MYHWYCFFSQLEPHKYQLWAYIYQARDLLAMDESGMNGEVLAVHDPKTLILPWNLNFLI